MASSYLREILTGSPVARDYQNELQAQELTDAVNQAQADESYRRYLSQAAQDSRSVGGYWDAGSTNTLLGDNADRIMNALAVGDTDASAREMAARKQMEELQAAQSYMAPKQGFGDAIMDGDYSDIGGIIKQATVQGLQSSLPSLAAGAVSSLAKGPVAGLIAGAGASYSMNQSDVANQYYNDPMIQARMAADPEFAQKVNADRGQATLVASALDSVTGLIGGRATSRVGGGLTQAVRPKVSSAIADAVGEGATEVLQDSATRGAIGSTRGEDFLQNFNPLSDENTRSSLDSFLGGIAGTAPVSAASHYLGTRAADARAWQQAKVDGVLKGNAAGSALTAAAAVAKRGVKNTYNDLRERAGMTMSSEDFVKHMNAVTEVADKGYDEATPENQALYDNFQQTAAFRTISGAADTTGLAAKAAFNLARLATKEGAGNLSRRITDATGGGFTLESVRQTLEAVSTANSLNEAIPKPVQDAYDKIIQSPELSVLTKLGGDAFRVAGIGWDAATAAVNLAHLSADKLDALYNSTGETASSIKELLGRIARAQNFDEALGDTKDIFSRFTDNDIERANNVARHVGLANAEDTQATADTADSPNTGGVTQPTAGEGVLHNARAPDVLEKTGRYYVNALTKKGVKHTIPSTPSPSAYMMIGNMVQDANTVLRYADEGTQEYQYATEFLEGKLSAMDPGVYNALSQDAAKFAAYKDVESRAQATVKNREAANAAVDTMASGDPVDQGFTGQANEESAQPDPTPPGELTASSLKGLLKPKTKKNRQLSTGDAVGLAEAWDGLTYDLNKTLKHGIKAITADQLIRVIRNHSADPEALLDKFGANAEVPLTKSDRAAAWAQNTLSRAFDLYRDLREGKRIDDYEAYMQDTPADDSDATDNTNTSDDAVGDKDTERNFGVKEVGTSYRPAALNKGGVTEAVLIDTPVAEDNKQTNKSVVDLTQKRVDARNKARTGGKTEAATFEVIPLSTFLQDLQDHSSSETIGKWVAGLYKGASNAVWDTVSGVSKGLAEFVTSMMTEENAPLYAVPIENVLSHKNPMDFPDILGQELGFGTEQYANTELNLRTLEQDAEKYSLKSLISGMLNMLRDSSQEAKKTADRIKQVIYTQANTAIEASPEDISGYLDLLEAAFVVSAMAKIKAKTDPKAYQRVQAAFEKFMKVADMRVKLLGASRDNKAADNKLAPRDIAEIAAGLSISVEADTQREATNDEFRVATGDALLRSYGVRGFGPKGSIVRVKLRPHAKQGSKSAKNLTVDLDTYRMILGTSANNVAMYDEAKSNKSRFLYALGELMTRDDFVSMQLVPLDADGSALGKPLDVTDTKNGVLNLPISNNAILMPATDGRGVATFGSEKLGVADTEGFVTAEAGKQEQGARNKRAQADKYVQSAAADSKRAAQTGVKKQSLGPAYRNAVKVLAEAEKNGDTAKAAEAQATIDKIHAANGLDADGNPVGGGNTAVDVTSEDVEKLRADGGRAVTQRIAREYDAKADAIRAAYKKKRDAAAVKARSTKALRSVEHALRVAMDEELAKNASDKRELLEMTSEAIDRVAERAQAVVKLRAETKRSAKGQYQQKLLKLIAEHKTTMQKEMDDKLATLSDYDSSNGSDVVRAADLMWQAHAARAARESARIESGTLTAKELSAAYNARDLSNASKKYYEGVIAAELDKVVRYEDFTERSAKDMYNDREDGVQREDGEDEVESFQHKELLARRAYEYADERIEFLRQHAPGAASDQFFMNPYYGDLYSAEQKELAVGKEDRTRAEIIMRSTGMLPSSEYAGNHAGDAGVNAPLTVSASRQAEYDARRTAALRKARNAQRVHARLLNNARLDADTATFSQLTKLKKKMLSASNTTSTFALKVVDELIAARVEHITDVTATAERKFSQRSLLQRLMPVGSDSPSVSTDSSKALRNALTAALENGVSEGNIYDSLPSQAVEALRAFATEQSPVGKRIRDLIQARDAKIKKLPVYEGLSDAQTAAYQNFMLDNDVPAVEKMPLLALSGLAAALAHAGGANPLSDIVKSRIKAVKAAAAKQDALKKEAAKKAGTTSEVKSGGYTEMLADAYTQGLEDSVADTALGGNRVDNTGGRLKVTLAALPTSTKRAAEQRERVTRLKTLLEAPGVLTRAAMDARRALDRAKYAEKKSGRTMDPVTRIKLTAAAEMRGYTNAEIEYMKEASRERNTDTENMSTEELLERFNSPANSVNEALQVMAEQSVQGKQIEFGADRTQTWSLFVDAAPLASDQDLKLALSRKRRYLADEKRGDAGLRNILAEEIKLAETILELRKRGELRSPTRSDYQAVADTVLQNRDPLSTKVSTVDDIIHSLRLKTDALVGRVSEAEDMLVELSRPENKVTLDLLEKTQAIVAKQSGGKDTVRSAKKNRQTAKDGEFASKKTTAADIQAEADRLLGAEEVEVLMTRLSNDLGGSGEFRETLSGQRVIEIAVNAVNPRSVGRHEALHALMKMLGTDVSIRRLKARLETLASSPHIAGVVIQQLVKLDKATNPNAAEAQLLAHYDAIFRGDKEEALAYLAQLWMDGNPAVLEVVRSGTSSAKVEGMLNRVVSAVSSFFRDIFHKVSEGDQLSNFLHAFSKGDFSHTAKSAVFKTTMGETLSDTVERSMAPAVKVLRRVGRTALENMRNTDLQAFQTLADLLRRESTSERGGADFITLRKQAINSSNGFMEQILREQGEAKVAEAYARYLQGVAPKNAADLSLHALFDFLKAQLKKGGVELKGFKGIPVFTWDIESVKENRVAFETALVEHGHLSPQEAERFANKAITYGHSSAIATSKYDLGYTGELVTEDAVFYNALHSEAFTKFHNKDFGFAISRMMEQVNHKITLNSVFGKDAHKIDSLFKQAEEQGATAEELRVTRQDMLGVMGLSRQVGMSAGVKNATAAGMLAMNTAMLPLALASQMMDPLAIAARTGDLSDAWHAYVTGVKHLFNQVRGKGHTTEGYEMAETLGLLEGDIANMMLGEAAYPTSRWIRKWSNTFFKANGMQGWNDAMRISSMRAAEKYLTRLAKTSPEKLNEAEFNEYARRMNELGISKKSFVFDADGNLQLEGSLAMERAVFRLVEGSVARADNSYQPAWMNDPMFALLAHMKRFTYAFEKNVLSPAFAKFAEGRGGKSLAILLAAVPVMIAVDAAKWAVFGGPATGEWGLGGYITHGFNRASLHGRLGAFINPIPGGGAFDYRPELGPAWETLNAILKGDYGKVVNNTVMGARYF